MPLVSNNHISVDGPTELVSSGMYHQSLVFHDLPFEAQQGNYSCDSIVNVTVEGFQSSVSGDPAFHTFRIESEFIIILLQFLPATNPTNRPRSSHYMLG